MLPKHHSQRLLFGVANQFQAVAVPQSHLELTVSDFTDMLELLIVVLSTNLSRRDVDILVIRKDKHLLFDA
jgi:hypothetical protein